MAHPTHRQSGFTLVELMISVLLGLLLASAVMSMFLQTRRSFEQNESVARMQEDARFALDTLTIDLSMAGFLADLLAPAAVTPDTSLAIGTDCGPAGVDWAFTLVDPGTGENGTLTLLDNANGAAAQASFSCIDAGEIQPGTDVIAIKRVTGRTAPAIQAGSTYLRTNGTVGLLYKSPMSAAPPVAVPAPSQDWTYVPAIYYVRNFANVAGDGIPTLCRKVLQPGAAANMVTECLAQGVEDLQVEYGVDTDGDGVANAYLSNPTAAQLPDVVATKIFLLARSLDADPSYSNDKTYQLSNAAAYSPADNFYRRTFNTTVGIRNIRNLSRLGG